MPVKTKVVILAAGKGTRMKSDRPKILHEVGGKPMIGHVLDAVRSAGIHDITCVIGYKAAEVRKHLKGVKIVRQKKLSGSAGALKEASQVFRNFNGRLLVLCGDAPLIMPETLKRLIKEHGRNGNFCTLLTACLEDPSGYGRIIKDGAESVLAIVEEIEASPREKGIKEINTGAYCFNTDGLYPILNRIKNNNRKKEYFLTDTIELMRKKGLKVGALVTHNPSEALGVNSRSGLANAEKILKKRILKRLMSEGVTIIDPATTYVYGDVRIGRDTVIYPNTVIEGPASIGRSCRIGPFARIRPGCEFKDNVGIGDFVELVRTRVGAGTLVKHHAYLGDAVVGKGVNIGAGTITANYDGKDKHITNIQDGAFLGSGTLLVAPVKIGKNAVTGAGAVVTKNHNVPPGKVAVGVPARILREKTSKNGGQR